MKKGREDQAIRLSEDERSKILSTTRLKVILSVFVVALLLSVGGLAVAQVSRIFDELTPAVARDLAWKSTRGAAELSYTTEIAIALGDGIEIKAAAKTYLEDEDVRSLLVLDSEGKVLFSHPREVASQKDRFFSGQQGRAHESVDSFTTWVKVDIEGAEIGKLALEVSKERLEAGALLRSDIIKGMAGGSLLAFVISLFFVSFYVAPMVRVTERAFIDLKMRTEEALESARLKSEFLANMSHEIRTPMNGVIGMGELLQKTSLSKKQRRYVRTISTSAGALLTIINDILDFSKIDAGKLAVRAVETDVRRVAEEVSQLLAPLGQSKGIEVMVSVSTELPLEVMIDRDRLRQVLNNIMGNAVKFTNEGSVVLRVWVVEHLRAEDACIIGFSVTDTGIGIAPEDQSRVFDHFSQADGSLTRTAGGTGLGLSISRHLVELMGGSLGLTSEFGKGSCFEFRLRAEVVLGEGSRPGGQLPRTLIVDDNDTNRTILEEIFESWGVPNDSARSAAEAMEMLTAASERGEAFELALLDQVMDEVNGFELARRIREVDGLAVPRLVLVTSMSESGALDAVFDDGLTKPVLQDDLRRVVQGVESASHLEAVADHADLEFVGSPRVLVAEDNAINREVMREILEELNLQVDLVENGEEAVAALERIDYPLVLMDCQMPVMDGYEATRRIRRRSDERSKVPIVAVTAHAVQGEREKAVAAGMTDYITKPVTITRLVRMMSKFLEVREVPATAQVSPSSSLDGPSGGSESLMVPLQSEEAEPVASDASGLRLSDGSSKQKSAALISVPKASRGMEPKRSQTMRSVAGARQVPPLDAGVKRSKAVVGLFRRILPQQIAVLQDAVLAKDEGGVKQHAHKLKGGCLALGATHLASICAQMEPSPEGLPLLLGELKKEHERVLAALSAEEVS